MKVGILRLLKLFLFSWIITTRLQVLLFCCRDLQILIMRSYRYQKMDWKDTSSLIWISKRSSTTIWTVLWKYRSIPGKLYISVTTSIKIMTKDFQAPLILKKNFKKFYLFSWNHKGVDHFIYYACCDGYIGQQMPSRLCLLVHTQGLKWFQLKFWNWPHPFHNAPIRPFLLSGRSCPRWKYTRFL
jgi:hypothetical protein